MKLLNAKIGYRLLLISFFLFAALKILLVGFDIDEQYAIAMSYRFLKGDLLILDMWEPHQTSGFLCSLLMALYLALTKTTTGIFLYLRICGLLIHLSAFLIVKNFLCQVFKHVCDSNRDTIRFYATFIASIFFFTLPKIMFLPEFSNLQVWFIMLTVICLTKYYVCRQKESDRSSLLYLVLAGFCIMLEVLSYPSTILVFFFCVYSIIHFGRQQAFSQTIKELTSFVLPCAIGAFIFCGYLLSYMKWSQLLELLPIVASDGSHSASFVEKITVNFQSLKELLLFAVIYGTITVLPSFFLKKRKSAFIQQGFLNWAMLLLAITLFGQLLIWIAGNHYPNYPHAEYFFLPILTILWALRQRIASTPLFTFSITLPLIAFCSILLFTNHPLIVSAPFLGPCAIGSLVLIGTYLLEKKSTDLLQKNFQFLLVLWSGVLLFGHLYLVRTTGGMHYTVLDSLSLIRQGPAAGIIADTDTVKKYNAAAEILTDHIPDKTNVFYAGSAVAIYLQGDIEIRTPSTISTPTYDDKVSLYFALHPQKAPQYIICDRDLTDLNKDNSWLKDYIRTTCEEAPIAGNDFFIVYKVSSYP